MLSARGSIHKCLYSCVADSDVLMEVVVSARDNIHPVTGQGGYESCKSNPRWNRHWTTTHANDLVLRPALSTHHTARPKMPVQSIVPRRRCEDMPAKIQKHGRLQ